MASVVRKRVISEHSFKFSPSRNRKTFLQLVFISSLRFSEEIRLINSLKLYHSGVKSTVAAAHIAVEEKWDTLSVIMIQFFKFPKNELFLFPGSSTGVSDDLLSNCILLLQSRRHILQAKSSTNPRFKRSLKVDEFERRYKIWSALFERKVLHPSPATVDGDDTSTSDS